MNTTIYYYVHVADIKLMILLYTLYLFILVCRYSITVNAGEGHLVLGRVAQTSELTDPEQVEIHKLCPSAVLKNALVYHRVMVSGVVYTNESYRRSATTNDYTLCFQDGTQKTIGTALKYLSFCSNNCKSCIAFCQHVVLVNLHDIITHTARHIHSITNHTR